MKRTDGSSFPAAGFIRRPELVLFGLLIIVLGTLIWQSDGFYRWDEGAHFVFDASALQRPMVSLGVWQRFGGVWLFTLPAQFGHKAVKVFASALFLLVIFLTYKVAEAEEIPGRYWVIPLLGFQPVFLDIGYTCLAELPAALLLVLSYLLYKKSAWNWSLLTASLVFVFRYEMYFFALLILLMALKKRQFAALPWVLVGPALWYFFSLLWIGDPLWLPRELLRYGALEKYQEGASLLHYITNAPGIFGWATVLLFVVACVHAGFQKKLTSPLIFLTVFLNILISTLASSEVVHWTGAIGDVRYLAPIAPFFAVVALKGLAAASNRIPAPAGATLLSVALSLWLMVQTIQTLEPHTLSSYDRAVISLTKLAAADSAETPILTNHWAAQYAMLSGTANTRIVSKISEETFEAVNRIYVLWDPQMAVSPFATHKMTLRDLSGNPSVRIIDSAHVGNKTILLFLKNKR